MDAELANRLSVISQVLDVSMNKLMVQAIKESIVVYEGDPDYQAKRKAWIKELAGVGT
jgi:hypothetical protein